MAASDIVIRGAREHNLRNVNLVLPRNELICLTGVSGSGKSSLAFDTLYAEGQRRYIESLSSYARQFLGQLTKPDVDSIDGLSPSISISQKTSGRNPRSTVGTITEIYDFLRVLYARAGLGHCPECSKPLTAQTREQIIASILSLPDKTRFYVLAPTIRQQKGEYRDLFEDLLKQGFVRARVDGEIVRLGEPITLDRRMRHNIEVVVDRLTAEAKSRGRIAEAVDLALTLGEGNIIVAPEAAESDKETKPRRSRRKTQAGLQPGDISLSADYACTDCGLSFQPPSPQMFSFNSPQGMCHECDGLGEIYTFDPVRIVTDPNLTIEKGCIELIGPWKKLGRWRRHIYRGVADSVDRLLELESGTMAGTPWCELEPRLQNLWLWGTGEMHITYTWRAGPSGDKYGGQFDGLIPELVERYQGAKSKSLIAKLEEFMRVMVCPDCNGERLNPQARSVTLTTEHKEFADDAEQSLPEVCNLAITDAARFFESIELDDTRTKIAAEALKEIRGRLGFLKNVGLDYLTLNRTAPTLSGGESQRIRLAGQIGCGLVGVLYILDEPSIGLHPRDNTQLLNTLHQLRDLGNTVVVVEHDEDTMRAADHIIDFGPGPGIRGGQVVAQGGIEALAQKSKSQTGQFLSGKKTIAVPQQRREGNGQKLTIRGARHNNLKNIDAEVPLGMLVCVTGVSGSGKSSLIGDIVVEALRRDLNGGNGTPGEHDAIEGLEHLDKLIAIDQSPIGRTPRSNPSTYIKVFDEIRRLYTQLPEAKRRGYKPGRFSFNVSGGRCEACEGNGSNKLEMDFLADVWVTCPVCEGKRFNRETLQIRYKGKAISDVLEMDVQQALQHFENIPAIANKLQTLHDVGLDYLKLGQPSPTLSGGEAQRIKLARELVKKSTGQTLYLLDEPTTGLHFADIELLLKVLHDFADAGNTVLVVEHNLDVIKTADWILDLGPEGGAGGGKILVSGRPEEVAATKNSYTGAALQPLLHKKPAATARSATKPTRRKVKEATKISVRNAEQHNLKSVSLEIPREKLTVFSGPSGSGKTSLAMDTIYAEGQRRYVESLSSYARQFVGQMQKPALEHIEGLSPAIAIEQKNMGHTPRSTVGTVTEIYDYLRVLFARAGTPYCPTCDIPIGTQTADQIVDKIMAEPEGTRLYLMAPIHLQSGESYEHLWEDVRQSGYPRIRVDQQTYSIDAPPTIDRRKRHRVEIVVDRILVRPDSQSRIAESVEGALSLGTGVLHVAYVQEDVPEKKWQVKVHSQHFACDQCGRSFEPLTPHSFSFNSPLGWCNACEGLGAETGANPAALIRDAKLTLSEGAILLWPNVSQPMFAAMLSALAKQTGLPIDVPLESLTARQRRIVMYGTGEDWYEVHATKRPKKNAVPLFRFQYKGLYPALEEASRLSQALRGQLEHLVDEIECSACAGSRVREDAASVRFHDLTIGQICRTPLEDLLTVCQAWDLTAREQKISGELLREITNRLQFLVDVGLGYLTIGRSAPTLSGGESQRIRLASQIGSGLCGVLYVLDEPTIGLHPRDNRRLIGALEKLRDLGNTLLVVEHDREVVEAADQLLDFGPAAGRFGGEVVAQGTPKQVEKRRNSVTGPFLSGKKAIAIPSNRRIATDAQESPLSRPAGREKTNGKSPATSSKKRKTSGTNDKSAAAHHASWIELRGARHHNLRNVDARIPLGTLTCVTGVSGSGKSSLIEDVLYQQLAKTLHRARVFPGVHDEIRGIEQINKVIRVDQRPLGNSPTSNPATYTGAFDLIRNLFSQLPESKLSGYTPRRFSFNVPGGRCDACEGNGQLCIEMHFLPDVWVECDTCHGKRYNPETLAVRYHGRSIADVLDMSCSEAVKLFENIPKIRRILETLCDVGLDYLTLGQPAPTLSGGEAQRVKLASELARPDTGRTLYLLDEPTTGLHFSDIAKLLDVLNRLVDLGNTVVVIEHNLDVIKTADWIIDMGPEAGEGGGQIVTAGTPEMVVEHARRQRSSGGKKSASKKTTAKGKADTTAKLLRSYTGEELEPILAAGPYQQRERFNFEAQQQERENDLDIDEVGKNAKMPWEVNGRLWHTKQRVGRDGEPCEWDGRILDSIVDRVQELGTFSNTDWSSRTVVEIASTRKADGWFLHALTGERWIMKLKLRCAKKTFQRDKLVSDLNLKPLNDMDNLPIYGTRQRVRCKNLRGPWQEIQIDIANYAEIDKPEFWTFLERAVESFQQFTQRVQQSPEDVMPWKKLGQKWHLSRKGFPPGKRVQWDAELLEELCEILADMSDGQFLWNNQQVVHVMVSQRSEPWATLHTKKPDGVDLVLHGPKNKFTLGRVAELASKRELLSSKPDVDSLKLRFHSLDDLDRGDLPEFLQEHLESLKA